MPVLFKDPVSMNLYLRVSKQRTIFLGEPITLQSTGNSVFEQASHFRLKLN